MRYEEQPSLYMGMSLSDFRLDEKTYQGMEGEAMTVTVYLPGLIVLFALICVLGYGVGCLVTECRRKR